MTKPATADEIAQRVGHPVLKWEALSSLVQDSAIREFADVEAAWLELMWTLDAYRIASVPPDGLKNMGAVNRKKGDWFAELAALLLENRTHHRIAGRARVPGFSQRHQIDVAWPARGEDPLVCCETKVMGAPAYGITPARKAISDFVNRRKELKFAATDLKLYRRQQRTRIEHWDVWRQAEPPRSYFLWAARMEPSEKIETYVREARALIDTYLDGVGLFAWRVSDEGDHYVPVPLPTGARVTVLDDVLYRIESHINSSVDAQGNPPPPVVPSETVIDTQRLTGAD